MKLPENLLIYYGWLNALNSAKNGWDNEKVAQDISKYDMLVLGNGLADPSHGDFANTQIIIPRVKALNPDIQIFGYVTVNQDYNDFTAKVDQWETLAVYGIFLDEAGYDYGKNRADFNQRVDYVHGKATAKICIANAWNADHVLGTVNDPNFPNTTFNPSSTASHLTSTDWILLESFPINTAAYQGGYESASDWKVRGDKALSLYSQFGVGFISSSVIDNSSANGEALCAFAYTSAMMYGLKVFGTSDTNYGSSSAAVRFWPRPQIGNSVVPFVYQDTVDTDVYQRYAGDERLSLKYTSGQQASTLEDRLPVYGSLYAANNSATQSINGTATKYTLWTAAGLTNKMISDLTNKKIVALVPGVYEIKFDICASVGTAGLVQFHLRKNGMELGEFGCKTKLQTYLTDTGFSNFVALVAGDYLEIYVDGNNTTLSVFDSHLIIKKI
jgi:hypothetical protein